MDRPILRHPDSARSTEAPYFPAPSFASLARLGGSPGYEVSSDEHDPVRGQSEVKGGDGDGDLEDAH